MVPWLQCKSMQKKEEEEKEEEKLSQCIYYMWNNDFKTLQNIFHPGIALVIYYSVCKTQELRWFSVVLTKLIKCLTSFWGRIKCFANNYSG